MIISKNTNLLILLYTSITGYTIYFGIVKVIITIEYTGYEKFDLTMHCYLCSLVNDSDITLLEHEAAKWLSKENLYSVDWLPADIDAVDAISKRL